MMSRVGPVGRVHPLAVDEHLMAVGHVPLLAATPRRSAPSAAGCSRASRRGGQYAREPRSGPPDGTAPRRPPLDAMDNAVPRASGRRRRRRVQVARPERQPELHAVEAARQVAPRELLDLAHPVAQRVAVHEQLRRRPSPSGRCAAGTPGATRRARRRARGRRRRAARASSRRTRAARRDRPSRATAGRCRGPRTPPAPSPRGGRPGARTAPRAGAARPRRASTGDPAPTRSSAPTRSPTACRDRARSGGGSAGSEQVTPVSCAEARNPPPCARAVVGHRVGERASGRPRRRPPRA